MAKIKRVMGEVNHKPYTKAASETFAEGDVVVINSSGYVTKFTSGMGRVKLLGLITRDVLATDDDYASNSLVVIDCFEGCGPEDFEFPVETGTPTQALLFRPFVDLNSEDGVNVNLSVYQHVKVEKIMPVDSNGAYTVRGSVRNDGQVGGLVSAVLDFTLADFTDGGGAAGTFTTGISIPQGAVVLRSWIENLTGTVGENTTAVVTIGDGTDVDRYNTGTPSVAADASGVDMGVVSGTPYHSAAKSVVMTVTDGSDFTSITDGLEGTLVVQWLEPGV